MLVIAALVLLGGAVLAFSAYVSNEGQGFELTLQVGPRTTRVLATRVTISEGERERKCVLSLRDFRALREKTQFLGAVQAIENNARGLPTFELRDAPNVNGGALQLADLEPVEQFVLEHARACVDVGAGAARAPP